MTTTSLAFSLAVAAAITLCSGCGGSVTDNPPASEARMASPSAARPAGQRDTEATARQRVPDDIALAEQVALLRREVADLRIQLAHLPGAQQAEALRPQALSTPEARAAAEHTERLRLASAESAFRNEPEDGRWSREAVESVRGVFRQGDAAQRDDLRNVACRSRSCRIEIDSAGDVPRRVLQLAQAFPNVTAGQVDQGDGHMATVLYLSR
jgi:hypothetical protein